MKEFIAWLKLEIDRTADRVGLTVFAMMLYLLAVLILLGQGIPRYQGEAIAACVRGTNASYCSYPSTRAKCNDLR